jgi:hypothetical protein
MSLDPSTAILWKIAETERDFLPVFATLRGLYAAEYISVEK